MSEQSKIVFNTKFTITVLNAYNKLFTQLSAILPGVFK